MSLPRKILCPTDFSETSYEALTFAIEIATRTDAELHLLHVVPPPQPAVPVQPFGVYASFNYPEWEQAACAGAEHELRSVRETRVPQSIETHIKATCGEATEEILRVAKSHEFDMIVLGTHGRTGWRHLVLGSVAEKVARLASCPVLSVRPRRDGVTTLGPIKKILCPIDFSEPSFQALREAGELALRLGAELCPIHILEPSGPNSMVLDFDSVEEFYSSRSADAAQALLSAIETHVPQELWASAKNNRLLREAEDIPAEEILFAAEEEGADLIVLATHGKTGWRHLVFGSVAESVMRLASCPVLIIHTSRSENANQDAPQRAEQRA